jgi:DNA-binding NtrC family response regulator
LVVDDEVQVLKALARMLRRAGLDVQTTTSPLEALALLAAAPADVVMADFRMPEMTGSDLLAEVAHRHPATRRVLLTGYADQQNRDPRVTVLSKPWDDQEVLAQCRA